jgi:hypothetical protein
MTFNRLDWLGLAVAESAMKREKSRRLRLCDQARGVFYP